MHLAPGSAAMSARPSSPRWQSLRLLHCRPPAARAPWQTAPAGHPAVPPLAHPAYPARCIYQNKHVRIWMQSNGVNSIVAWASAHPKRQIVRQVMITARVHVISSVGQRRMQYRAVQLVLVAAPGIPGQCQQRGTGGPPHLQRHTPPSYRPTALHQPPPHPPPAACPHPPPGCSCPCRRAPAAAAPARQAQPASEQGTAPHRRGPHSWRPMPAAGRRTAPLQWKETQWTP